ncbi:hypothetical protein [Nocardiopsis sp. B62]|uniref:hypothetical protein n=1 Tax=Nocardiopsis sp. B62 TaxID=2824874 RepID=UPI001B37A6B2|nr:hypothetical protein [Nocardiopsis sp. B62]MBQ1080852.1 hypothetical protein [Nocardiopsis sp. B62]
MTERILPAISACLAWADEADPPPVLEKEDLALLLSVHRDTGAHEPGDWTVDDVHDVATVLRSRDTLPASLRDSWLSWCDHLVSSGGLLSVESPRRLRATIERIGLTPGLVPRTVRDPMDDAASPLLARLGCVEDEDPTPLLPYVPAPLAELDARAAACPTLHRAALLSAWVAPRRLLRPGTDHDELGVEETARAADDLGTTPAEIRFLFSVARSAALVRTTYLHVLPGPAASAWAEDRPGTAAHAWADALTTMAALPGPAPFLLLAELFLSGRARTPAELVDACGPGALPGSEEPEQHVLRALKVLADLDAVERVGPERYRATDLGDHCAARHLGESGVEVPVVPPVTDLDAKGFLDLVEGVRPVDVEVLLDRWLAGRAPKEAARALMDAGLPPVDDDPESFVRTVSAHPWADSVLARIRACPLRDTAALAR